MENTHHNYPTTFQEDELVEDTLSLKNLCINDNATSSPINSPRISSPQGLFEFITGVSLQEDEELNEYEKRDYLTLMRSNSFNKSSHHHVYDHLATNSRSISSRSPSKMYSSSTQIVNITSLTSMSSKSRRRMFMFGPVKFKPEMELSAIKERQGRRTPVSMFPASVGGKVVTSGGGKGHHWGMVRALRCRAHLTTLLARSFGCISLTKKHGLALL